MPTNPNGVIQIQFEIPARVYDELKTFIETTIAASLQQHLDKIHASEVFLTRNEAAKKLRITLPTLDRYLDDGRIESKRAGRRILIPLKSIESFPQSKRTTA